MLTYEIIQGTSLFAMLGSAAGSTNTISRKYSNNVTIDYCIEEDKNQIFIAYIEAASEGKGNGSQALQAFIDEFNTYDISLSAYEHLVEWYERFGFEVIEDLVYVINMKLSRKGIA